MASLFRPEAIEFHRQGGARGDVVQLTPRSFFWSHLMLVLLGGLVVFLAFVGQIDEHAAGPAIVRMEGVHEVTAPRGAVVARVEVAPGQQVQHELADQLAKLLREPGDRGAREALVSLRTRRDLAQKELERQTVTAPFAAVVGDVRARAGQLVEPGAALLSLLGEQGAVRLTALLPGRYRPLLAPGMRLRFRADGFPRAVHELRIERVADQIVGPAEALRFLGRDSADTLQLQGSVLLVDARLPTREFRSEHATYRFHHGMQGWAESAVRRDSIAFTFIPGLRQLVDNVF
jgi:membrane fusion protein (multidrug efflux system)